MNNQTVSELDRAAAILRGSAYTIALVGAGMSKESGIPTFRGDGGLWTRMGEPPMDGYRRLLADPKRWWEERLSPPRPEMAEFTAALEAARPNPGHYAMAQLEQIGLLQHIITQNVDNLHYEAGSRSISEIHGNRHRLRCLNCSGRFWTGEIPLETLPPHCPECDGLVKTDTVMFGEPIPADVLERCYAESQRADCALVVGTSALVFPAADFPVVVARGGGRIIEVNTDDTPLTPLASVALRGASGDILPRLVELLGQGQA